MTLDSAIQKATLFYSLVGTKVKKLKKNKIKTVMRITAYKKDAGDWDVAVFFVAKYKMNTNKPDCFLSKFIKDYEVI